MNIRDKVQLLLLIFLGTSVLFIYLLRKWKKDIMVKEAYSIFRLNNKRKLCDYLCKAYLFFIQWKVSKEYLHKILKQYEIIMPGDKKEIQKESMKTVLIVWSMDISIIVLLFISNPSLYSLILTITFIYIINNQVIAINLEKADIRLLKQTIQLIVETSDNFKVSKMIKEVLEDVEVNASNPMRQHIKIISRILSSEEKELEERHYEETIPNRFLKIFLSLCLLVEKYGDKKVKGESIFLNNLKYLRMDIESELLKKERIKSLFQGFIPLVIAPILFVIPIKNWAIQVGEGIDVFYDGVYGTVAEILIFIGTIGTYHIINRMKETSIYQAGRTSILSNLIKIPYINHILDIFLNKNYGKTLRIKKLLKDTGESLSVKEFILKRMIYSTLTFLFCIGVICSVHSNNKVRLIYSHNTASYYSSYLSEKEIQEIDSMITEYTKKYKNARIDKEELKSEIETTVKDSNLVSLAALEIENRVKQYKDEYLKWYELTLAIFFSIFAYYIPYGLLCIWKKHRQKRMEDEVAQFQSIVLMLMHLEKVTVELILEWMEKYSNIFHESIQMYLNNRQSGDVEALEKLEKSESYEPFHKFVQKLKICDKVAVEKVFSDVYMDRNSYYEKRKLENEITINQKYSLGSFIVYIPFFLVSVVYLTIPMIWHSLIKLEVFLKQLNKVI